ncbi:hypothetical protein AVEN_147551-1 [Araneus ventricosus]|uniref:Uncharacterized protein n=1 Tax=Araneus ventricosus TaxID=182803 RepID=A0A4Y2VBR8_ARAVE|nr:hypothetical protein AVEN_147551-1 [Araneus ventricosus]
MSKCSGWPLPVTGLSFAAYSMRPYYPPRLKWPVDLSSGMPKGNTSDANLYENRSCISLLGVDNDHFNISYSSRPCNNQRNNWIARGPQKVKWEAHSWDGVCGEAISSQYKVVSGALKLAFPPYCYRKSGKPKLYSATGCTFPFNRCLSQVTCQEEQCPQQQEGLRK